MNSENRENRNKFSIGQAQDIAGRRDFIISRGLPCDIKLNEVSILVVGETEKRFSFIKKELPECDVYWLDVTDILSVSKVDFKVKGFNYIDAVGVFSSGDPGSFFSLLLSALKPGGILAGSVHGYAGYHGLVMVSNILRKLSRGRELTELCRLAGMLAADLPTSHPAFERRDYLDRLRAGEKATLEELLNISDDSVFTVEQLMSNLLDWGGDFNGWVHPELYDSEQRLNDQVLRCRLAGLPNEKQYSAVEMISAGPWEHHFLAKSC